MVALGMVDGMVSGATHTTAETIRPAFELVKTRPGVSIVSSVFLMCLADRVLVYGDCAVNPHPTAEQLADIAISSAETAAQFGIEPRVAMLSYSTGASGSGAEVERVREATEIVRARAPELSVEGPIQYDAAVDAGVARTKLPGSEVAGRATVFIFPDLNTGNNTYKAVQRSANAIAIGPVLQGLNKPVNDLSRGATVHDIVNTVAITAIQALVSVFVVNCGSSSLKWSVVDADSGSTLGVGHGQQVEDHAAALAQVLEVAPLDAVEAVAHRVVHGGERFSAPVLIDDAVRGRDPRPGGARAAAQPGQRGRDRGRAARVAGGPARRRLRHRVPRHAAAARVHLRRPARVGRAPLRLPRHLARVRLARGGARARPHATST